MMPNQARKTNVCTFPNLKEIEEPVEEVVVGSSSSSSSSSTTTTIEKPPYIDISTRQSLAVERLKATFYDCFGREMPRAIRTEILKNVRNGTPIYYYRYAIEQTALAPRPSWRYTMAIVQRLQRERADITSMDEGRDDYFDPT